MEKAIFYLTILLGALVFFSCGSSDRDRVELVAPLDSIRLGMTRPEVEQQLPIGQGAWQANNLFSSLTDIRERSLTNHGLKNIYLYYRKEKHEILNAVILDFETNQEQRLLDETKRRYGQAQGRLWKLDHGFSIELAPAGRGGLKLIYDTQRLAN